MNFQFKKIIFLLSIVFTLSAFGQSKTPKYVFLFIGDGMGLNQVYTTELYFGADAQRKGGQPLLLSSFPVNSLMTTYSANSYITCSSAAVTAMSAGHKTNNGVLGKSPTLDTNYLSLGERVKQAGYKVGILSSVSIDHATPAGFYAHQNSRNMYYEISMELPNAGIDYFGGGGFEYPKGRKNDQANSYDHAVENGYRYVSSITEFNKLKNGDTKILAVNPKLYPKGEFFWEIDQVEGSLSLADFTQKGIEVLENDKGFFMMVEGGKIDWACHSNDLASMFYEVKAFDEAVAKAYEFYQKHPDETLIIVTADHETGSLFQGYTNTLKPELLQNQKISLQEFSRKLEDFKKEKPKASFDDVMKLITADFGLGDSKKSLAMNHADSSYLMEAYVYEFVQNKTADPDADYLKKELVKPLVDRAVELLNHKAGFGWGTDDHSASPVPVRVIGAGAELFGKNFDNTDLPKKIAQLMGLSKI
jgi:alkaline phosphatase